MIPKIEFRYSFIYQEEIHLVKIKEYKRELWEKKINKFISRVEKKWRKIEKPILKYIEKITKLKWKENKIICYVINLSKYGPISDPLTIPISVMYKRKILSLNVDRFIDMLIHELIHNFFIQNDKESDKYFDYLLNKKYKNFSENTKIHVIVHAIHKKIFDKFFGKKRLMKEIGACSSYPDYKKAWEIVLNEGANRILKEFRKFILTYNK